MSRHVARTPQNYLLVPNKFLRLMYTRMSKMKIQTKKISACSAHNIFTLTLKTVAQHVIVMAS